MFDAAELRNQLEQTTAQAAADRGYPQDAPPVSEVVIDISDEDASPYKFCKKCKGPQILIDRVGWVCPIDDANTFTPTPVY